MSRIVKLIALQPIQHGAELVVEGAALEVTEQQAEQLVAVGSAESLQTARARAQAAKEAAEG